MMSRRRLGLVLLLCGLVRPAGAAAPSPAASATPLPSPPSSAAAASPTTGATAMRPATPSAAAPSPSPTRAVAARREPMAAPAADAAPAAPLAPAAAATAVLAAPRAYRTPERTAPAPFVAPQGGAPAAEDAADGGAAPSGPTTDGRAPAHGSSVVVFRVTGRTALEGFDIRVGYPRAVGSFGTKDRPAECNAGTGLLVVANDRGDGELRLLVASAQALPFPLDVFCRFTAEPGAGIGGGDLAVRIAEVTSGGKRADPGLLLVNVGVR
ncbi:MAG: hypothetical protein IT293_06760 [Deltaproteobacteria bacterium]|nr:hypothetical protein [Deltaproteobacteria bacterium]